MVAKTKKPDKTKSKRSKSAEEAPKKRKKGKQEELKNDKKAKPDKERKKKVIEEAVEAEIDAFNPLANIDNVLDDIEKSYALTGASMLPGEKRQTTGLLGLDLVLGGGIVPGWYTTYGPEQSCKSTLTMWMLLACVNSVIPIKAFWDYEGSGQPDYIEKMMKTFGLDISIEQLFGVRNPKTQAWEIKPLVRPFNEVAGEKFFDWLAKLERSLPDKKLIGDTWYYIYENTKPNKAMLSNKYDAKYFSKTGMLRVPAPDGKLQAIVLLDSYPAMLPEKQDVDDPGSSIAVQARMFSDQLKRVKGRMRSKRIAVLGVNQLRKAPMVMFGCFTYSGRVRLANGTTMPIGEIVEKRLPAEVMAYNKKEKTFEARKVVNWFNNGKAIPGEFIQLVVSSGKPQGLDYMTVTQGHKLLEYTKGYKAAGDFKIGELLTSFDVVTRFNSDQLQFIYGSLLGDGSISRTSSGKVKLRFGHSYAQAFYLDWKRWLLEGLEGSEFSSKKGVFFDTQHFFSRKLTKLATETNVDEGFRTYSGVAREVLDSLDLRGVAIWYQDDGTFYDAKAAGTGHYWQLLLSCKRLNSTTKQALANKLQEVTGVVFEVTQPGLSLRSKDLILKFTKAIAPYMLEGFEHKLPLPDAPNYGSYSWDNSLKSTRIVKRKAEIVDIRPVDLAKLSRKYKYDIEVEGNHNYIVSNCVVHNSPEQEPGGEALKFFSDCRLKATPRSLSGVPVNGFKGKGMIMEEDSITSDGKDKYRFIHVKAIKNKLSMPYLETWIRLWIEDGEGEARGFDPVWDTFYYLKQTGQLTGDGKKMTLELYKGPTFKKALTWLGFKTLVLGSAKEKKHVCEQIGASKIINIRDFCTKQLESGKGLDLYLKSKKNKEPSKTDEGDDDED
jgi:RecA/RadA recombinase